MAVNLPAPALRRLDPDQPVATSAAGRDEASARKRGLTRRPRADRVKRQQADFFGHFKPEAQEILSDLLEKYTGDSELKCSPASGPVEAGIKLASSLGSRLKGPSNYSMHSRAMVT
jgi:hypothetical protein